MINTNEDKEEYGKDIKKDFHPNEDNFQKMEKFDPNDDSSLNFDDFDPNDEGKDFSFKDFDPNDEYTPAWEDFDPNDEYTPAWEDFDPNDEYTPELKDFSNNLDENELSQRGEKDDTEENFSFRSFRLFPKMERSLRKYLDKPLADLEDFGDNRIV